VVGEAVLAFELARAFLEKFGGDSLEEVQRNYQAYMDPGTIKEVGPWRPQGLQPMGCGGKVGAGEKGGASLPYLRVDLQTGLTLSILGRVCWTRQDYYLKNIFPPSTRILVVGDPNTLPLFGRRVGQSLKEAGFTAAFFAVPAGEEAKELEQVTRVAQAAVNFGLGRDDLLVALGGGAVGDLTGFCAASYMRGVALAQLPTTLLAQVDSSVGGKVAVNHPGGKNMLGFFYQPRLVLMDPDVLDYCRSGNFAPGSWK
jgi:3-dehydroquinate synthetase